MANRTDYRAVLEEARQHRSDSLDKWDPQQMDYESSEFNRYDVGPGRNLPRKKLGGGDSSEEGITLFVQGIPNEMTEEGLENLFCKAGKVTRVKKMLSKKPDAGNTYGFITMSTFKEATKAMQMYHNFAIGQYFHLSVRVSMSDEERQKRKKQKQEEEIFLNSLPSNKKASTNGFRLASGNESDSSSSSAGKQSMPLLKMQQQQKSPGSSSSGNYGNRNYSNKPGILGPGPPLNQCIHCQRPGIIEPCIFGGNETGQNLSGDFRAHKVNKAVNLSEIDPSIIHSSSPLKPTNVGSRFGLGDQRLETTQKDLSGQQMLSDVEDLKITIGQDSNYGDGSRHISPKGASVGSALLSLGRGRGRGSLLSMVDTNKQSFSDVVFSHNRHSSNNTGYTGRYAYDSMGTYGHGMNMRGFRDNRNYESGYGRGHHSYRSAGYSERQHSDYRQDQYWSGDNSYGRGHKMGYDYDYYNGQRHNRDHRGHFGKGRGYDNDQYYYPDYKRPGSYSGPKFTPGYSKAKNNRDMYRDDVEKVKHVEKQTCSTCGTLGTFNCSRCKTPYCSEDCQKRAWPEHKKICKRLSESNKDDKKFEQQFDISFGNDIVDKMKYQVEKITGDKVEVKPKDVKQQEISPSPKKQELTSSRHPNDSPKKQSDLRTSPKISTAALATSDLGLVGKIPGSTSTSLAKKTKPKDVSTEQILMEEQSRQPQLPRNETETVMQQSVLSEDLIKVDQLSLPDLPINTEIEVAVTEVGGPDSIWIQDVDSLTAANDLLIKLNEASQTAEPVSDPVIGGMYLSQFSIDNAWYRTVVESISGDYVSVCFIDYGNKEVTLASGLKKLPKQLAQESLKAVQCYLGNVPSEVYDDMAKAIVMSSVEPVFKCQQLYRVTVVKKDNKRYAITIKDLNGDDVGKKLIDAGLVQTENKMTRTHIPTSLETGSKTTPTPRIPSQSFTSSPTGFAPPTVELPLNKDIEVMLSEVCGPDEIYIQSYSAETVENIHKFPQEMTGVCSKVKTPLSSPIVGVICAAKYSEDGQWYRARIEAIPERDLASVIFIDFGNRENVPFANLQALPQQFLRVKVMATKCYLDVDTDFMWDKEAITAVKELLVPTLNCGKTYSLVATKRDDKGYGVLMKTADGLDVTHMLRKKKSTDVPPTDQKSIEESQSTTVDVQNCIQYASLPLNEEVEVVVTEVVSPAEIWINKLPDVGSGAQINSVLTQIISQFSPVQSPVVGGIYAGQFSVDNTWYRARVESLEDNNNVNVLYIDYGNKEQISVDQLRELHPDLLVPEAYAIQCCIDGISPPSGEKTWSDAVIKFFKTVVVPSTACQQSYKVTAIKKKDNIISVVLKDTNGIDISQKLVQKGMAVSSTATAPQSSQSVPQSILQAAQQLRTNMAADIGCLATEMREGQTLNLLIVEIESPTQFYVQINDENRIATYSELQKELDNTAVICADKEYRPKEVGELVIALFSEHWYRAKVLSIGHTKCRVLYIDFGNKEEVEFSMIRPAFEACTRLPAQAMTCALDSVTVPSSGSWSREDTELFMQLIVSQPSLQPGCWEACVKRIVGSTVYIDIKTRSGDSVSNLFMQSRTLAPQEPAHNQRVPTPPASSQNQNVVMAVSVPKMDLSLSQRLDTVVVTFNNFHSFYLQTLADDQIDLRNLMVNLGEHCMSDETPYSPVVGELVCAMFEEVWYRASVLDKVDGYFVVQYVDFGNSESVDCNSIRKLPQSFATVPFQAIHCRLSGVGLDAQTEETITTFVASTVNVASKTEAVRKDGPQYEVIMYSNDGLNINEQLQPLPNSNLPADGVAAFLEPSLTSMTRTSPSAREFDLIITFAVSPDEFYIQLCDQDAVQKLAILMQEMMLTCDTQEPDQSFNPIIDTLCCAYYQEDNSWYRGAVTQTYQNGSYQVHYLDFGNREIVTADKLRRITPGFLELPIMAIKCRLADIEPVGSSWNPEAAKKMKLFFEKRLHAVLIDETPDICTLRIVDYDNDVNMADYLIDTNLAQRSGMEHLSGGGDAADNNNNDEEELQRQILALQAKLSSMKTKK